MYFGNPTGSPRVHAAMTAGLLGYIDTPLQGNIRIPGVTWCADNGCFNDAKFDTAQWWGWLQANATDAALCAFATAPDVVGDAASTYARSKPWLPLIRRLGYPVAYVAQDGIAGTVVPWDDFDVLFIGGTDGFKLGPEGRVAAADAKRRDKGLHMGRVSSLKRYRYAEAIGCDSADGTYLRFGPDKNLPNVLGWYRDLRDRPALFGIGDAS